MDKACRKNCFAWSVFGIPFILSVFFASYVIYRAYVGSQCQINPGAPRSKKLVETFELQSIMTKADIDNNEFTCVDTNGNGCYSCMANFNHLKRLKYQDAFSKSNSIHYIKEDTKLEFTMGALFYNSNLKVLMEGSNENPFDLHSANCKSTATISIVDSDGDFKNIRYNFTQGPQLLSELDSKYKFKEFSNWMRVVLGLKFLRISVKMGFGTDWPLITAQISAYGERADYGTCLNLHSFREGQTNW